ncbi:MAG: ATP-binding cassette domain-containing protein [Candidatus Sumerlaeota bacterium]|nr:ATP-binding cassette domain-containing protein [Candidatus Sumerlaeota bacterium]
MSESATMEICLQTRGLRVEIEGALVLDGVDFDLACGQMIGMVGPSGGGKTTFIHVCLGRLKPAAGFARILGVAPQDLGERRARIGYSSQRAFRDFPPQTRAIDFVLEGGLPADRVRRRPPDLLESAKEALELADTPQLADRPIGGLDAVRFWRVRLARALVNRPQLVILDELGEGLMAHERLALFKRVAWIKEQLKFTALLVSRDLAALQDIVHEIVCLNHKILFRGAPSFLSHDTVMKMYPK